AGPDFDLAIEIHAAQLPDMNDLLESYGNFQVRRGTFSFFSEITIEEGHIIGYMRPLSGDVDVAVVHDEEDGFTDWIYDTAVGAASAILENMPRDEVATDVDLAGPLNDPEMSTWKIIRGLLRNAFFEAILPGFESEV